MAKLGAVQRLTGTTGGETPLVDGTMRTAIVAVLNALLVVGSHLVHLSDADTLIIVALATPLSVLLFGVWDRKMSPKPTAPLGGSHDYSKPLPATITTGSSAPTVTDVNSAMKAARLPADKRIETMERPEFRMKTQPRTSSGQFATKKTKRRKSK